MLVILIHKKNFFLKTKIEIIMKNPEAQAVVSFHEVHSSTGLKHVTLFAHLSFRILTKIWDLDILVPVICAFFATVRASDSAIFLNQLTFLYPVKDQKMNHTELLDF